MNTLYKITLLLFCTQSFAQTRFVVRPDEVGFVMLKCKTDSLQISIMDVSGEENQITILAVPYVLKSNFNEDSLELWYHICKDDTAFYSQITKAPTNRKFLSSLNEIKKGRAPKGDLPFVAQSHLSTTILRFSIDPGRKSRFQDGSTVGAYFDIQTDSTGSIIKIWKKKQ